MSGIGVWITRRSAGPADNEHVRRWITFSRRSSGSEPYRAFTEEDANTLLMQADALGEICGALAVHMEAHGVIGFPDVDGLNALVETLWRRKSS